MRPIELIDRAAVLDKLPQICDELNGCTAPYNFDEHCVGCEVYMLHKMLTDLPTIDAAPVRRGEWVMVDEYCNHAKTYECTACRGAVELDRYTRCCDYDFCPNCGADMRKEDTHEPEDGRDREELERLLG